MALGLNVFSSWQRSAPVPATRATVTRNSIARCRGYDAASRGREHLVPLPDGGGYLLPCTTDLFGPGYAFRMTSSSSHNDHSLGIERYHAPKPPIVSQKGRAEARVIVYHGGLSQTEYEPWESCAQSPVGLLPQPEIAGVLPGPSEEAKPNQPHDSAVERLVVGKESGSPRRSLKLQFTCNRCDTRNVATVNPLAWRYGTVFIECGGCNVKHKMVDHLHVAEEVGITAGEMDLSQQERMRDVMRDVKMQPRE